VRREQPRSTRRIVERTATDAALDALNRLEKEPGHVRNLDLARHRVEIEAEIQQVPELRYA
jgi:hypothetical protein